MGKVKAWAMDLEEQFEDKIVEVIKGCDTWHEFTAGMEDHFHLVSHLELQEIMDILSESWSEYWSKYDDGC
jgi:hypothetical protein